MERTELIFWECKKKNSEGELKSLMESFIRECKKNNPTEVHKRSLLERIQNLITIQLNF